nr:hypothetical protein WS71_00290 [Burkholderia mayonis]
MYSNVITKVHESPNFTDERISRTFTIWISQAQSFWTNICSSGLPKANITDFHAVQVHIVL